MLRRAVLSGLARRIIEQRARAGTKARPAPLRPRQSVTATPTPRQQGAMP
jgi:hypothetical protein